MKDLARSIPTSPLPWDTASLPVLQPGEEGRKGLGSAGPLIRRKRKPPVSVSFGVPVAAQSSAASGSRLCWGRREDRAPKEPARGSRTPASGRRRCLDRAAHTRKRWGGGEVRSDPSVSVMGSLEGQDSGVSRRPGKARWSLSAAGGRWGCSLSSRNISFTLK